MFALLTLPFKIVALLLTTLIAILRTLVGLAVFLLNPFVVLILAIFVAYLYFR